MEVEGLGDGWYYSREEIDKFSPSRKHGIDAKKENNLRKSYSSYIKEVGVKLGLPQVAIATAILFCHRFYLRQSHHDYDRYTIATACIFLAGKVEENPITLITVVQVAYEIRHKRDPTAKERIREKEVYAPQRELIVMAERVVLSTLAFDLNMQHPYKYLVSAIKLFKVAQPSLAQVAWNFVNDGLVTTLCLQYKPQHIAAGAIFLGAKFLKVKLPVDLEKPWWQEFDVSPKQLEDISNQMLELYEQNKAMAASISNDVSSSQGQPLNISINTKIHNTKTGIDAVVGHKNQDSTLPKPLLNKITPEAKKQSESLTANCVAADTNETTKGRHLPLDSKAESGATSLGDTGKMAITDVQEQKCVDTLKVMDRVEGRKRKRSRWDDTSDKECLNPHGYVNGYSCMSSHMDVSVGEPSTITSVNDQVQPTCVGMVSHNKSKAMYHEGEENEQRSYCTCVIYGNMNQPFWQNLLQ